MPRCVARAARNAFAVLDNHKAFPDRINREKQNGTEQNNKASFAKTGLGATYIHAKAKRWLATNRVVHDGVRFVCCTSHCRRWRTTRRCCRYEPASFAIPFCTKNAIVLPRQARDHHRERKRSKRGLRFLHLNRTSTPSRRRTGRRLLPPTRSPWMLARCDSID